MDAVENVLEILQEARDPVSGEDIAAKLGISRNAVWKAVGKLREEGYEVEAATNRGYWLVSEEGAFTPTGIHMQLKGPARQAVINIRDTVTSTNTVLKEIAEKGGAEGMVVIAQQQSMGKGRLGRSFYSPKGTGLYMSLLLRPKFSAEEALSITTAAAVAVAGAVEEVCGLPGQIKWVNDVYLRGRKVCGILTEAAVDFENKGLHYAVLGMGVNLREPPGGFSEELKEVAGALFYRETPPGAKTKLAAEILNRFFKLYGTLPEKTFLEEYRSRSLLTGVEITFTEGSREGEGTVLGIDENMRLVVQRKEGGKKVFSAGEVTIKKDFLNRLRKTEWEQKKGTEK